MTPQEIFEKVVTHLFTQGRRSLNDQGWCRYRGDKGTSCAVGCLIPDEVYDVGMEGSNSICLLFRYKKELPDLWQNSALLNELQEVHDYNASWMSTSQMKRTLKLVAKRHCLDTEFMRKLRFRTTSRQRLGY